MKSILSEKEDAELILNIKNKCCNESAKELIERHSPLFYKMVNIYGKFLPKNLYEDLIEEKWAIFNQAFSEFDPEKNVKFSSFLGDKTKFRCLKEITDNKKNEGKKVSLDKEKGIENLLHFKISENLDSIDDENKNIHNSEYLELKELVETILNDFKDSETRNIVKERFSIGTDGKNKTLRELAEKRNVTPQAIAAKINKFLKYAKKRLTEAKKIRLIKESDF